MRIQRSLRILVALALFSAPAAFALNNRSAVSVTGLDTNPCTTVSPCRSFVVAIGATNPGGEIIALDSAGYGPFTITIPVTVSGAPGVHAAITVTSGAGIIVNVTTIGRVILRNLVLIGAGGTGGIVDTSSQSLTVSGCLIRGFSGSAVLLDTTAIDLAINGCTIIDNVGGTGIVQSPGGNTHTVVVADSLLQGNAVGIHADSLGDWVVADTTISGHSGDGVEAGAGISGEFSSIAVKRCTIVHNGGAGVATSAVDQNTFAIAFLSQDVIAFNIYGVINLSAMDTFNNNRFVSNGSDVGAAMAPHALQ